MAGTILIQRTSETSKNYFGYLLFGKKNISWLTQPVDGAIDPGTYTIPGDWQNNLNWFYDNGFEFDQFGRLHVLLLMLNSSPDTVILV
jgi:hypothetical protein